MSPNPSASPDDSRDSVPVPRWRFWAVSALLAVFAVLALARALQEPSIDLRFTLDATGHPQATSTGPEDLALHGVRAVSGGGERVELTPLLLVESAGIHNRYADHDQFFAGQAVLWRIMHAAEVRVEFEDGVLAFKPGPKDLHELGLRFWFPWVLALLSMSVGLAVWIYRPGDYLARWYMLASVGYGFGMLCTAGWGSRLLTQSPAIWPALHVLSHVGSFMLSGGLCMVLWRHPSVLGGRWFGPALLAWCAASVTADALHLAPTIALAFRLPIVIVNALLLMLYVLQWRASRGDPVKRAQLRWLGMLLFIALSVVFVAYAFGAMGYVVDIPQNYGLGWIALVFVGLVPLVARVGLFRLDRWWAVAWLWFLGGLLVVVLDVLLLALLPLGEENALAIALAVGGWIYFPLRQALWRRLSRGALPDTRDLLPDVVRLVTSGQADAALLNGRWRSLWERTFQPQAIVPCAPGVEAVRVDIAGQGQILRVPGWGALQPLQLSLPERGRRLFNMEDLRRAGEIVQLVQHGLASQGAYGRGVREERQRVASDLHDDLGAKLLTIAQASESPRVAALARQALDEMRLSLRGLSAEAAPAADVLADWRSETVSRLDAAGLRVQWEAAEPPPGLMLGARTHVQLTRVLREAVSNCIRHSGARACAVRIALDTGRAVLEVEDDGRGLPAMAAQSGKGHGLPNIEQRVRKLGGRHEFSRGALGGTRLRVEVPLDGPGLSAQGCAQGPIR